MDTTNFGGPLPVQAPEIQEYEVGLIRMPANNSLLGVAYFRVYVRSLNPDTALLLTRTTLPEAVREQCFFNVKPWPHQDIDERIKQSTGLATLVERVTAPEPAFQRKATFADFADWSPYELQVLEDVDGPVVRRLIVEELEIKG